MCEHPFGTIENLSGVPRNNETQIVYIPAFLGQKGVIVVFLVYFKGPTSESAITWKICRAVAVAMPSF